LPHREKKGIFDVEFNTREEAKKAIERGTGVLFLQYIHLFLQQKIKGRNFYMRISNFQGSAIMNMFNLGYRNIKGAEMKKADSDSTNHYEPHDFFLHEKPYRAKSPFGSDQNVLYVVKGEGKNDSSPQKDHYSPQTKKIYQSKKNDSEGFFSYVSNFCLI